MKGLIPLVATVIAAFAAVGMGGPGDPPPSVRVLRRVKIGGEGRWDFLTVDAAGRRLFVPRSTHVLVLDLAGDDLKQVGEIPDTKGVHGVALAPELGRGFTSNGQDNSVSIFD